MFSAWIVSIVWLLAHSLSANANQGFHMSGSWTLITKKSQMMEVEIRRNGEIVIGSLQIGSLVHQQGQQYVLNTPQGECRLTIEGLNPDLKTLKSTDKGHSCLLTGTLNRKVHSKNRIEPATEGATAASSRKLNQTVTAEIEPERAPEPQNSTDGKSRVNWTPSLVSGRP